jgi:integrase
MTILKRGKSKFWYIQFQIGGRTIIKSSRSTSRKVAEQMEAQLRTQVHARVYLGHKPGISLADALTKFAASKEGTPNHRNVLGHLRTIQQVISGATLVEDLTSDDIDRYCRARKSAGIGSQALKHGLNVLRGMVALAKRLGYRTPDLHFPAVKVSAGRLRYLSQDEELALLAALDPQRTGKGLPRLEDRPASMQAALQDLYDLVVILIDTGARYGEISKLEWRQIDLEARAIRLWRPKVRNESIIFMTGRALRVFERRARSKAGDYVFTNKKGGARGHPHLSWRKAFNRAGLHDCTIHTLRHTHATRLIQNGLSVYEVQTVLGHSDPKTTMRYAHLEAAKVTQKARDTIERIQSERQLLNRLQAG